MRCKHKYGKIEMDEEYSSNTSMKNLAKQGNKSIDGLMRKCVAVNKKGCSK